MTTEQSAVYRAAIAYANLANDEHLGELVTAVMDLPMEQWPENACNSFSVRPVEEQVMLNGIRKFLGVPQC